ncbi:alkane 1-monooxygenase [Hyphobacterium sp. CCMP332]|nr:alkane 1-monooxygenase [Hyphobacterium sp. CCMP332]
MKRAKALKYLSVFSIPVAVYISLTSNGWWTYITLIEAFLLIPFLELFISADDSNLSELEEEMISNDPIFDLMLYLVVPVQYAFLIFFLFSIQESLLWWETAGRISAFGILCGVLGINVAHELGHRSSKIEQFLSKSLLLTSLYMHFYIEHNRGHHKNVSTHQDPASSRYNESLYSFWIRSIVYSYISAWKIEFERMKRKGLAKFSLQNEMLQFQFIQLFLIGLIALIFSFDVMLYFIAAATIGFLLLETVNYIEHYGLSRNKVNDKLYERVKPIHSWNSNHVIGRIMLFELSRHSDHHFKASKKYQLLKHHENSPQMPTGYPGMMLLSAFPPLWFMIMNKRIENLPRE